MTILKPWFKEPQLPSLALEEFVNTNAIEAISEQDKSKLEKLGLLAIVAKLTKQGKLTDIEWLVLLNKGEEVARLETLQQTEIGRLVYKGILNLPRMFSKMMQKLVSDYEFGYASFPEAFNNALLKPIFQPQNKETQLQLLWVKTLISDNYKQCACIALSKNVTPSNMTRIIGFNPLGKYINKLTLESSAVISNSPTTQEQAWWVTCQNELEISETITMLEQLLEKLTVLESNGPLDEWISKQFLPDSKSTHFYKLNENAQQKLLSLYNVTTYDDVEHIFSLLRDTSIDPSLNEREERNLKSRIDFWSDYSDSFKRVRFMLTARAYQLLMDKVHLDTSRISIMPNNLQNNLSEICIFEFDNHFIIERFRNDFDMGVFKKKAALETLLFSDKNFDAANILTLKADGTHDHRNDYQYFVKEQLRSRYGINANKDSWVANRRKPSKEREDTRNQVLRQRYAFGNNYFNSIQLR